MILTWYIVYVDSSHSDHVGCVLLAEQGCIQNTVIDKRALQDCHPQGDSKCDEREETNMQNSSNLPDVAAEDESGQPDDGFCTSLTLTHSPFELN